MKAAILADVQTVNCSNPNSLNIIIKGCITFYYNFYVDYYYGSILTVIFWKLDFLYVKILFS